MTPLHYSNLAGRGVRSPNQIVENNAEDGAVLIWGTPATGTEFGLRKGETEASITPLVVAACRAYDRL